MAIKRLPVLLTLLAMIALTQLYGHYGYPLPTEDPAGFMPPAVNLKAGRGLYAEANLGKLIDRTGQDRFLFYPPVYPYVISKLMLRADIPSAFMALALIESISLVLFVLCLGAELPGLTVACLLALTGIMNCGYGGRPETLGMCWLLIGMLACMHLTTSLPYVLGVLLGVFGATHPVGSIFSAFLIGCWFTYHKKPWALAIVYPLSVAAFFGVLALSPWPIRDTLTGMLHNGQLSTINGKFDTWHDIIRYTFIFEPRPFIGLVYFLPAILAIRYFRSASLLFKLFLGGFFFALWWFGFRIGVHMYNAMVLLPLMLWTIHTLTVRHPRWLAVSLLCTGLVSATLFRFAALFPFYLHQGLPLQQARALFKRLDAQYPGKHYNITAALFVLDDQFKRLYNDGSLDALFYGDRADPHTALLIQQAYMGFDAPPPIAGYTVVENGYVPGVPRLFGIKIANRIPGYQFALYEPAADTRKR